MSLGDSAAAVASKEVGTRLGVVGMDRLVGVVGSEEVGE